MIFSVVTALQAASSTKYVVAQQPCQSEIYEMAFSAVVQPCFMGLNQIISIHHSVVKHHRVSRMSFFFSETSTDS